MPSGVTSGWTLALMKIVLMVFDFALWVFGCLVLATGIWVKLESHKYLDVDPSNPITYQISVFLMTAGAAIALVGLLSCYCTLSGSPILLYLYSAFLGVILILEISMGIAAFAYRQTLEDSFKNGLQNSMRTYQTIEENRDAVDLMQRTLQCCGVDGYQDWQRYNTPVPESCCKTAGCKTTSVNAINQIGCYTTVVDFIDSSSQTIGIVLLVVAAVHVLGLGLTCLLANCINKWKYETIL